MRDGGCSAPVAPGAIIRRFCSSILTLYSITRTARRWKQRLPIYALTGRRTGHPCSRSGLLAPTCHVVVSSSLSAGLCVSTRPAARRAEPAPRGMAGVGPSPQRKAEPRGRSSALSLGWGAQPTPGCLPLVACLLQPKSGITHGSHGALDADLNLCNFGLIPNVTALPRGRFWQVRWP